MFGKVALINMTKCHRPIGKCARFNAALVRHYDAVMSLIRLDPLDGGFECWQRPLEQLHEMAMIFTCQ